MHRAQLLVDVPCRLGEGPNWHPDEKKLYWTDIEGRSIYRVDPENPSSLEQFEIGRRVGGFTLEKDGRWALMLDEGGLALWSPGNELDYIHSSIPTEEHTRFNDVIAGPRGEIYAGTMQSGGQAGRLYRIDPGGDLNIVREPVRTPNGMGFSPDRRLFYFIDTPDGVVYAYDYLADSPETLVEPRVFIEMERDGHPDGMTVDNEGNLWIAFWGGYRVECFSPDGKLLHHFELPVENVTSLVLVENRAYVTSASGHERPGRGELAGSVFTFEIPTLGVPEFRSNLAGR